MKKLILLVSLPFIASFAPKTQVLCKGFLPETSRWNLLNLQTPGPVTEAEFNAVIAKVQKLYSADFEKLGEVLKIEGSWDFDEVNAIAYRAGKDSWIRVYGGLARHGKMNRDGLVTVLCHEVGHFLGGFPQYGDAFQLSFEGEADYFATLKCARRFFSDENNEKAIAGKDIEPIVRERCKKQFSKRSDELICLRSSLAAYAMAELANDHSDEFKKNLKYADPDKSRPGYTERGYPWVQCRLDTYFAGLTCQVSANEERSKSDYRPGSCYTPQHTVGHRPYCWFEPEEWITDPSLL